ncbi:unnamed protein product [Caenorhabditis angaria]|uniref:Amino acid transporter n=1 Tax=Caenorhabditis angaria TaxID=860376 RepID=A0A9P1INF2_9PELO|nr:unnamed protein product [Caenorhabditis angaria]
MTGASLPQAIQSVEENIGVDKRIAGFIMPLGNTINMDGNALYEAVAVIFIAQLNNIQLNFADIITICVTATFASIGLNAVPAGLVSMFVILTAVGLPVNDIPLLFTVDWLIDRVRTALNVLGDAFCADVIQHFMKNDLEQVHILIENPEGYEDTFETPDIEKSEPRKKKVSFADMVQPEFNSTKTYSLKSAIIQPLRAHLALQTRLSQLSEE